MTFALVACDEPFTTTPPCEAPTCRGAGATCLSHDFEGSCPADWALEGNIGAPGVVVACQNGKLRVAASNTLEAWASLEFEAPSLPYSMHVSMRLAFDEWDGGRMVTLSGAGSELFRLDGTTTPRGDSRYDLCRGNECVSQFECARGEEHLFEIDLSEAGFAASVDCNSIGTLSAVVLPTSAPIRLDVGKADANPIAGTIDDVVISFR